ncbi:MAG TPA: hypothetical protein VGI82_10085, partial [Chitinophagaceae bacterium]
LLNSSRQMIDDSEIEKIHYSQLTNPNLTACSQQFAAHGSKLVAYSIQRVAHSSPVMLKACSL